MDNWNLFVKGIEIIFEEIIFMSFKSWWKIINIVCRSFINFKCINIKENNS